MSRKLKIISLNVRGLRNQNKRGAIFSYLKTQKSTVFCLQETYLLSNNEKVWSLEWDGQIIYSHGTAHSKGVYFIKSQFDVSLPKYSDVSRYVTYCY